MTIRNEILKVLANGNCPPAEELIKAVSSTLECYQRFPIKEEIWRMLDEGLLELTRDLKLKLK